MSLSFYFCSLTCYCPLFFFCFHISSLVLVPLLCQPLPTRKQTQHRLHISYCLHLRPYPVNTLYFGPHTLPTTLSVLTTLLYKKLLQTYAFLSPLIYYRHAIYPYSPTSQNEISVHHSYIDTLPSQFTVYCPPQLYQSNTLLCIGIPHFSVTRLYSFSPSPWSTYTLNFDGLSQLTYPDRHCRLLFYIFSFVNILFVSSSRHQESHTFSFLFPVVPSLLFLYPSSRGYTLHLVHQNTQTIRTHKIHRIHSTHLAGPISDRNCLVYSGFSRSVPGISRLSSHQSRTFCRRSYLHVFLISPVSLSLSLPSFLSRFFSFVYFLTSTT